MQAVTSLTASSLTTGDGIAPCHHIYRNIDVEMSPIRNPLVTY
jgi:hypothetical protein